MQPTPLIHDQLRNGVNAPDPLHKAVDNVEDYKQSHDLFVGYVTTDVPSNIDPTFLKFVENLIALTTIALIKS